jgi:hypothetical protein
VGEWRRDVLPAHAGVIPGSARAPSRKGCAPRAGRGDPLALPGGEMTWECSRAGGDPAKGSATQAVKVCSPAHAGDPWTVDIRTVRRSAPRGGGGDPDGVNRISHVGVCSPRTRGDPYQSH